MPRRVAVSRHVENAAVAEQIVLAIHQLQVMAVVIVGLMVTVGLDQVGVVAGPPFPFLHHQLGILDLVIAAHMIEMQV